MPRIRDDEPGPGRTHALAARVAHAPEAEPNPAVEAQLRAPPAVARQPSRHRGDTAETGREALELVRATWFPAYRRAVDAFDAAAALELAHHVVRTLNVAEEAHHELDRDRAPSFGSQLAAVERDVATKIGPQMYRDKPTLGSYAPPQLGVYASGTIAAEAATMVELLAVIQQLRQVAAGAAGVAQRQVLSGLVQPFARRPVSFAFLARYMVETGVWQLVANDRNLATGATLEDADRAATEQLRETGPTADVGGLDARTLQRLLDGGIDDARAMTIVEKLATAALDARAPLLHQIDRAGKLDDLCAHLPWAYVQELHDSIVHRDPQLASRLTRYFEGKGGGRSMHRMYMDNFDEHAKQGHTVRAAGYFALDFLHNMLTAGFEHEYSDAYDAREEGLITDAQYRTQAHKALGKAAVILAVSALTGGAAGEFLEGASAGLGAGKQLSSIIGGTAGGAAAGAGGHLAGDVYDQLLSGKDGFDSLGDYAKSAAVGGAMGFAASALSSLSVGSGKYLGPDQARPVDTYAARYPQLARVLERIRATGFRSGSTVRMRVQELLDLVSSGFGGPGGPTAFALAGGGDVRALPPETEVEVSLRPLAQPMQSSTVGDGSANEPQVAVEKVGAPGSRPTPATSATPNQRADNASSAHRVTSPVTGLFDAVDPGAPAPSGWTIRDQRLPDGALITRVEAPNGARGHVERIFDPTTKRWVMVEAFFGAEMPGWIETDIAMVPGSGTPLIAYLDMRAMKMFGIEYGSLRSTKLSSIQNVETVCQVEAQVRSGVDVQQAVRNTASVRYAETELVQSGHRIVDVKLVGGTREGIDRLLRHYEGRRFRTPEQHDAILERYGMSRTDEALWNFDIYLELMPFSGRNP